MQNFYIQTFYNSQLSENESEILKSLMGASQILIPHI